jgi:hypothetical protein
MGRREIILVIVGMAIGKVLAVLATVYFVNNILVPGNPSDPLARQGGLKPERGISQLLPASYEEDEETENNDGE